jgi:hypothetical protein
MMGARAPAREGQCKFQKKNARFTDARDFVFVGTFQQMHVLGGTPLSNGVPVCFGGQHPFQLVDLAGVLAAKSLCLHRSGCFDLLHAGLEQRCCILGL